eukprot:GFUD01005191.1.p1 GENE.GFUD01005191.1~~GFUD01005191.1.p1  ORF type:complete len:161 (+),score=36.02 GFUD01005191.1:147-629(+)
MGYNHPSVVTTLLSSADTRLDITNRFGWTGLHTACYHNNVSVITVFCSDARCTPAIVNMKDKQGRTALMAAVKFGHLEIVRELVRVKGQTLIEGARQQKHAEMLQFLGKHYFVSQLRTLKEIAAYNIAKDITGESDIEILEIPRSIISLVTMFLGTHSGD